LSVQTSPDRDRVDISELMITFVRSLDDQAWDAYAETFVEDGVFEILGQQRVGRSEIAAGPARDLSRYARTQHFSTNHQITLHGDSAEARHDLFAVHVPDSAHPERHADIGGVYRCNCVRTPSGWRFAKVQLEILWNAGADFALARHGEATAQ
jgi:hypothetical protein